MSFHIIGAELEGKAELTDGIVEIAILHACGAQVVMPFRTFRIDLQGCLIFVDGPFYITTTTKVDPVDDVSYHGFSDRFTFPKELEFGDLRCGPLLVTLFCQRLCQVVMNLGSNGSRRNASRNCGMAPSLRKASGSGVRLAC